MTDTDKLTKLLMEMSSKSFHVEINELGIRARVEVIKEANSAILDLFLTLVPEEPKEGKSEFYKGVIACRSQLLANIERLRQ